ncbi:inactive ubiquitin carboxyl-terminal hydrolase 50 [Lagopus muta]|uniref:inactive ubiquitin carboxyl-terminal hydrolase 50 n=1 Tax=Lagopus muta TaxID=64668 RepID=UPI00209C97D7|nr:inactive ubiquitin carboxyl-terminal hydrolase 50 [Lagopus muta]
MAGRKEGGNPRCVNAILRCLCRVSLLLEYFLSGERPSEICLFFPRENGKSATTFGCSASDVWLREPSCISLGGFCSVLGEQCPTVSKRTQWDVQEFICMLNKLHEALKKEDTAVKATTAEVPEVDLYLFNSKFYFKFERQGNYKRKLFTDICYPLSNMDLSPYSYTFFCKNSGTACVL